VTSLSEALAQQGPANLAQPGRGTSGPNLSQDPQDLAQLSQMLAGQVAGEVLPLVRAELGASLGPWLSDTSANLKRLDTHLAVSIGGGNAHGRGKTQRSQRAVYLLLVECAFVRGWGREVTSN
jgi:hypothetical protein